MRVIIIHHILWAHYKNAFYEELLNQAKTHPNLDINILQIAKSEQSREQMPLAHLPKYKHQLLFDEVLEDIPKSKIFKKLFNEINNYKPTIVNINGFFTWYHILITVYCKLKGIKIIFSNDSTANDNQKVFWKTILKRIVINISDAYYAFGTKSADYLSLFGAKEHKFISKRGAIVNNDFISKSFLEALPNKQNLKETLGIQTIKNFIFVGRLVHIKNLPLTLRAFKKALSKTSNSDWGFVFLGDGVLKEPLQSQIAEQNIKNTYFLGGKSWHEVPEYLTLADTLVLSSSSEAWGLVVNEAMICGLPVVVSSHCGCAVDLIDEGNTGFQFDYEDEEKLASIFIKIMNNEVNLEQIGKNAQDKIKEFSPITASIDMIDGFYKVSK